MNLRHVFLLSVCFVFAVSCSRGEENHNQGFGFPKPDIAATPIPDIGKSDLSPTEIVDVRILGDEVQYKDPRKSSGVWQKFGVAKTYPAGTQFHHWGPKSDVKWWAANGIAESSIRESIENIDHNDMNGGGFYVSLAPTDTKAYGDALLISEIDEPQTVVTKIDEFDYSIADVGYKSRNGDLIVKTTQLADAGVSADLYMGQWLNIISSRMLKHLYEGSWDNFGLRHGQRALNYGELLSFATKYPLTEAQWKTPAFHQAFPVVAGFLLHEPFSPGVVEAESHRFFSDLISMSDSGVYTGSLYSQSEPWTDFFNLFAPFAHIDLSQRLRALIEENADGTIHSPLTGVAGFFGISLAQLNTRYQKFGDLFPASEHFRAPYFSNKFDTAALIYFWAPVAGFYQVLTRFSHGHLYPWFETDEMQTSGAIDPGTQLQTEIENQPRGDYYTWRIFCGIRSFLKLGEKDYRDQAKIATGADGSTRFPISTDGIVSLKQFPFITRKFSVETDPQTGQVTDYVELEYPSARNYQSFRNELADSNLVRDLDLAHASGKLADESSAEFRMLTQRIVGRIAQIIMDPGYNVRPLELAIARLAPFKERSTNSRFLRIFMSKTGNGPLMVRDEWFPVMGGTEFYELEERSSIEGVTLRDRLSPESDEASASEVDAALGLWELAADRPLFHRDPQKFIREVKARLLEPDVQTWIEQGDDERVRDALHEAGVD